MSPIGLIALATIEDIVNICEKEAKSCEAIIHDLEQFSDKLDQIDAILFGEEEKPKKRSNKKNKKKGNT